jgi:hypothetical protein
VITILHITSGHASQIGGCFSRITNRFRVLLVPLRDASLSARHSALLGTCCGIVSVLGHTTGKARHDIDQLRWIARI